MKKCKSDFGTYEFNKEIILNDKSIWIDGCLAEEIEELNKKGVRTMASCCGHKQHLPTISVDENDIPSQQIMKNLDYQELDDGMYGIAFIAKSVLDGEVSPETLEMCEGILRGTLTEEEAMSVIRRRCKGGSTYVQRQELSR